MTSTFTSFSDLDDGLTSAPATGVADIRANAHIANGGNAKFDCPKCNGSGMTRWGRCFKCDGKGEVSRGVIAAAKGKITKANNRAQWLEDNAAVVTFLRGSADRWQFAADMLDKIEEWGKLTENQMAVVQRSMEKSEARKAEWAASKVAAVAAAPEVDVSAIESLFATARSNGLKRPVFRAEGIEISMASATGNHAGSLWIKSGETLQGKVQNGRFVAFRECLPTTGSRLIEVAADPLGQAKLFGQQTGTCSCCGRELTDPISIENGIGPICQGKWGL